MICKKKIRTQLRKVEVSMLNLSWFFHDRKNFVSFAAFIDGLPLAFYDGEFQSYMDH